ncbi:type II toxin-antitoxin system RelE family toxin [Thermoflavimicrobium dichotomicum]|uniref:mRNA-degrading endonuclease RelE, toxin component of the RelBE toxin-antitoxin system n=1 Tax=Thermoflavimicrobium dichotomicum TaxID=46223 RepID=A0A1I3TL22_9BACL|nr:hypothetical protein [Thermoflavimicrobium dichotomicum]SFJ71320.1 mRNA-degrading endonuclease RelE, toxin component of the RelBE toxin-antitoxin system [Thermoflavimicrobium dichotomicum]
MSIVALQDTFLDSFAKLPKSEQKRMRKMIDQLRYDQWINGLNLERLRKTIDPHVYSARLSQGYRVILVRPDNEDVFLLVWVDHHDEAYRWAERKRFIVNQTTGTLQMWTSTIVEVEDPTPVQTAVEQQPPLFAAFTDEQLEQLGVPSEFLPLVRRIRTLDDFKLHKPIFPNETYEYLDLLVSGESFEEVLAFAQEIAVDTKPKGKTITFAEAVTSLNSSRTITVVTSDKVLDEILKEPLDRWRVFLHPRQRETVERSYRGPVRVLGGAGTGKTVVASGTLPGSGSVPGFERKGPVYHLYGHSGK